MVGLGEALRNAARSAFCTLAGPVANGLELGGNIYRGLGGEEQGDDLVDAANLYRNAQNVACSRTPAPLTPQETGQGFEGGQCVGEIYRVQSTYLREIYFNGSLFSSSTVNGDETGPGPLSYESFTQQPPGGQIGETITFANGEEAAGAVISGGGPGEVFVVTRQNLDIQLVNGNPDNCGDPPPNLPTYNPDNWSLPSPITYDDFGGNPVTETPTFTFGPTEVSPGFELTVPITVDFESGSQLFGDFNLTTGDITFSIGNSAGDGADILPTEDNPGELTGEERIIGARVSSVVDDEVSKANEIFATGSGPNLFFADLGTISWKIVTPSGTTAWTRPERIQVKEAYFEAPKGAVDVSTNERTGVTHTLSVITTTEQECCG